MPEQDILSSQRRDRWCVHIVCTKANYFTPLYQYEHFRVFTMPTLENQVVQLAAG